MVLLEKLWDDVVAGPQPDRGLGRLRKLATSKPLVVTDVGEGGESSAGGKYQRSMSMPTTPATPSTPTTPASARKENVWRSVFNPGSNLATKKIGGEYFDKPQPNSPTVYDWLYSGRLGASIAEARSGRDRTQCGFPGSRPCTYAVSLRCSAFLS